MKIRLRFRGSTKILQLENDQQEALSLSDIKDGASQLYVEDFDEGFGLSLNGKDILEDETALLSTCDIVSGDLIHVVSKTDQQQAAPSNRPSIFNKTTSKSTSSSNPSGSQEKNGAATGPNEQRMDIGQPSPGSSHEPQPVAGASADPQLDQEEPIDLDIVNQCLSEPILCREASEGRVPSLLRDVYEAARPESEAEAIAVVLHVLMMETGFIISPEPSGSRACVPDRWRYPGYYKLTYTYPGCADIPVSLTVITTGNSLAVHGKVLGEDGATRMCSVKSSDFVKSVTSDCAQCYCQLARLNIVFKDSVASPLMHDVRSAAGLEEVFGLMALTFELKLRVLSFLDVHSLLTMSRVNSLMADITKDAYLWRRLYLKTFGNRRDNGLSQDWKKLYQQEFKARKERRKLMSKMVLVPPLVPTRNPYSNTAPWLPPNPGGIIGGDYDLYPNLPGNLPGMPGRGGQPPLMLPRPRYDLIGPPGVNPNPDPNLLPVRPGAGRGRMGPRPNPFGGGGGGFGFF